jgi:hypothetical protein
MEEKTEFPFIIGFPRLIFPAFPALSGRERKALSG